MDWPGKVGRCLGTGLKVGRCLGTGFKIDPTAPTLKTFKKSKPKLKQEHIKLEDYVL
jgi:hypothetical protein